MEDIGILSDLSRSQIFTLRKRFFTEGITALKDKLPAGTKWEEITIKFEDDENVYIQVKQFKHTASYKELGLVGRGKNPNPSELWAFLKVLAQVNGELAIKDTQARDKYKKQKELLAKALQSYLSQKQFYTHGCLRKNKKKQATLWMPKRNC